MFRIKICGVGSESDIDAVAEAGADAIGLNFHPSSIRFVDSFRATELSRLAAKLALTRVGVFVQQSAAEIAKIAESSQLDAVQLHGDQTLADARWLSDRGWKVIRVIRLAAGPIEPASINASVEPWRAAGFPVLFDADAGAHGGGMGLRLDWESIGKWSKSDVFLPRAEVIAGSAGVQWGLAGGLAPETVGEAILKSGAAAIDVASGVEEPRGKKSRHRVASFVDAATAAWRQVGAIE